jgi:hypothetical protein
LAVFKFIVVALLFSPVYLFAQSDSVTQQYKIAFDSINSLAKANSPNRFKDAVYWVENTYQQGNIDKQKYDKSIDQLVKVCRAWANTNPITSYKESDSKNFNYNIAIFKLLKDTIKISFDSTTLSLLPYQYDFDDFAGKKDWRSMFVTKLIAAHKGNCHSLPYLYKMIADELGAKCWLALAPNHIYIKNYSKKDGWYNTELTSGEFPIDAWLSASGYIPLQALQNGLYCDTLSNQQTIALCLLDLAKGYERQTKNYYDGFILKCCDKVLEYHPMNAKAMLLKAETLKRVYEQQKNPDTVAAKTTYSKMEQQYVQLYDLGYREMPEKMYQNWLLSVMQQKDKYSDKKLTGETK